MIHWLDTVKDRASRNGIQIVSHPRTDNSGRMDYYVYPPNRVPGTSLRAVGCAGLLDTLRELGVKV